MNMRKIIRRKESFKLTKRGLKEKSTTLRLDMEFMTRVSSRQSSQNKMRRTFEWKERREKRKRN